MFLYRIQRLIAPLLNSVNKTISYIRYLNDLRIWKKNVTFAYLLISCIISKNCALLLLRLRCSCSFWNKWVSCHNLIFNRWFESNVQFKYCYPFNTLLEKRCKMSLAYSIDQLPSRVMWGYQLHTIYKSVKFLKNQTSALTLWFLPYS